MMMTASQLRETLPDPMWVVSELDKHIIGQTDAKKALSLLLLNRGLLKLKDSNLIKMSVDFQKSNVLLLGPSGVGKTSLIQALSKIADIPIPICDVTQITAAGYIGGKVEDILSNAIRIVTDYVEQNWERFANPEDNIIMSLYSKDQIIFDMVRTSIIYIDEIDKIRAAATDSNDVNGDMVQNELLKFLEGTGEVNLQTSKKTTVSRYDSLPTKDILFVCGGAFSGLSDIIYQRLSKHSAIGFNADISLRSDKDTNSDKLFQFVNTDDLIKYGFKPEFLGRLPIRANLNPLTAEEIFRISKEPKNSICKRYEELFKLFDIELIISDAARMKIAEKALSLKSGARSLQALFNAVLEQELFRLFTITDKELFISEKEVEERCSQL